MTVSDLSPMVAGSVRMTRWFTLAHGVWAYRADVAVYLGAVVALLVALALHSPPTPWWQTSGLAAAGLLGWTLVEYGLHRFVLHGMAPFRHWHAAHHAMPTALIYTPTVLSAGLFALLVFLPVMHWGGVWPASAWTLGMLVGYLGFTVTHHATHHWRARAGWLRRRKAWHARHHHLHRGCYGVTSGFWDRVFGSADVR
ncbi:sterol desaturase family protein [Roseateles amylovorans]|uniref:Sterol desaturase family protein n=1 Tax=Roseateles amylovorans TaxID=2978473 RepID=A0ABY6AY02_9BURK|nr:sterol desaturase family protein [Roseateles amylovorans]UXH76173.1 sterol desaturase family protein [Roseateles amylovorans]